MIGHVEFRLKVGHEFLVLGMGMDLICLANEQHLLCPYLSNLT